MTRGLPALVLTLALAPLAWGQAPPPPTPAEAAGYQATTRHADVEKFCITLAAASPRVQAVTVGTTHQGRTIPALVLAPHKLPTPADAVKRGKPVVLAFANIHAGEVDGKEALRALARDFAAAPAGSPEAKLLDAVTLVLVPDLNADGNEKVSDKNRTDQNGPPAVGERANAQGFDLNRDFVKLESPEVRSLVRFIAKWNPLVVVDCHTTNGSFHRYTLTHDGPRNPAAGSEVVAAANPMLADIGRRVKLTTGFDTFAYGDFAANHTRWETYPAQPRFGVQYLALTGRVGLLSESYTYAPFADRVKASRAFVLGAVEHVAANPDAVAKLVAAARVTRPRVALRTKTVGRPTPDVIRGYVEALKDGKPARTDTPADYTATRVDRVEATLEVPVPAAYYIPPGFTAAVETLQRHGVKCDELTEDVMADAERFTVTEVRRAERLFQKHALVTVDGTTAPAKTLLAAGGVIVPTAQPLGNLAAYLLEPQAEDGLTAWNLFDAGLAVGKPFPVVRLPKLPGLATVAADALPEDRPKEKKPITIDVMLANRGRLNGSTGSTPEWLPDGEHTLQPRAGRLMKVAARTGEATPFIDRDKLRKSLAALADVPEATVEATVRQPVYRMDPARTGTLVELGVDLAFAKFDGTPAVRLTKAPAGTAAPEYVTFSPDGKHVAYVRAGDLYAVDIGGKKEVRLTADGRPAADGVLNGKADWVYEEEIFDRNGKAFWWHPAGGQVVFLRFDDKPVKPFHLTKQFPARGELEVIPYPKAGDPNPHVKVGVADVAAGTVRFLDPGDYKPADTVICRVGFLAGATGRPAVPFAYVQNREQTWLDFVTWPDAAGKPVKLVRDTTKAWVEDLGEPHVLRDGSFLIRSERTGWKHLYHYGRDGKLIRPLTDGEWEVQSVDRVDEAAGVVYATGTKDGSTRTHAYAVKLDGGGTERVTPAGGTHRVSFAPKGALYLDRWSDAGRPPTLVVREVGRADPVRTADATPVRGRDAYIWGKSERVRVPMTDGFVLEGDLTYPADFDPAKKYPLWVLTYAGPHAPTVKDGYAPHLMEQVVANLGVVAFNVDPRSASGKGAQSAWACYKQFGVQELRDLEEAVGWVRKKGWLDPTRVGISGHSYGGFMAAYALTHGQVFTAGIAGAPVTDWPLYDTIYTERYMGTPQSNPEGYKAASVVRAAAGLHGRLLIVHGMIDDNVHLQNSAQLIEALQKAGKTFEVMVYPTARHGIPGGHYPRTQVDFIKRTMAR